MTTIQGLAKAAIVLVSLYCLLFQGMGDVGFLSADEPRYAAIGKQMAATGDLVTPVLWGKPWFEKPPLVYWMMAGAWRLGFHDEVAARLPGAMIAVGFLVFFFWWMRREFDEAAAWRATLMLATCAGWIAYSTVAVMDVPLTAAFGVMAMMAAPWRERPSKWAGVGLGLAILAKALVPLLLGLPILWFWRKRWRALVVPLAIGLAITLPWYVACYVRNGYPFLYELFLRQQFGRFFTNERQHVQPIWFYVPVLVGLLMPWPAALARLGFTRVRVDEKRLYLLALAGFGVVFFSLSLNKLPGYVLPLLPLVIAAVATEAMPRWAVALSGVLTALIPMAAVMLPEALEFGLGKTRMPGLTIWAGVAAISAAVAVAVEMRWRRGVWVVAMLTVGWISWAKVSVYPELDDTVSARGRWRDGQRCLKSGESRDIEYGLAYYNGAELRACK